MKEWTRRQFRTFAKVYAWWRDQLTVVGKLIFLVMICSLPTLADSDAAWAIVFMASSMILLATSTASFVYRPRLTITVTCPKYWMRSQCRAVALEITNRSRRAAYDLQLDLLPSLETWEIVHAGMTVPVLLPGETVRLQCTLIPLRRGEIELPHFRATTFFPLQIVRRSETYNLPRKALILPFYHELRCFALAQSVPSIARGNTLALQTVGLTGEYVGSREYQPGIPVRRWDYSSWARLGQPVVREFAEPRHPSAAVIVDLVFPSHANKNSEPIRELEALLSLAAAITGALLNRGTRIDFLSIGDRVITGHERETGENHLVILEHLALAQPCHGDTLSGMAREIERTPVTWDLAIVLSHRWGAAQEQLLRAAARAHVTGAGIVVHGDGQLDGNTRPSVPRSFSCAQVEAGAVEL